MKSPKAKPAKKPAKAKTKNLVLYVENCTPKVKVFDAAIKAKNFVKEFNKKYAELREDNWADLIITDIRGDIKSFYPLEIEDGS